MFANVLLNVESAVMSQLLTAKCLRIVTDHHKRSGVRMAQFLLRSCPYSLCDRDYSLFLHNQADFKINYCSSIECVQQEGLLSAEMS